MADKMQQFLVAWGLTGASAAAAVPALIIGTKFVWERMMIASRNLLAEENGAAVAYTHIGQAFRNCAREAMWMRRGIVAMTMDNPEMVFDGFILDQNGNSTGAASPYHRPVDHPFFALVGNNAGNHMNGQQAFQPPPAGLVNQTYAAFRNRVQLMRHATLSKDIAVAADRRPKWYSDIPAGAAEPNDMTAATLRSLERQIVANNANDIRKRKIREDRRRVVWVLYNEKRFAEYKIRKLFERYRTSGEGFIGRGAMKHAREVLEIYREWTNQVEKYLVQRYHTTAEEWMTTQRVELVTRKRTYLRPGEVGDAEKNALLAELNIYYKDSDYFGIPAQNNVLQLIDISTNPYFAFQAGADREHGSVPYPELHSPLEVDRHGQAQPYAAVVASNLGYNSSVVDALFARLGLAHL